jgi:hypothetical protein
MRGSRSSLPGEDARRPRKATGMSRSIALPMHREDVKEELALEDDRCVWPCEDVLRLWAIHRVTHLRVSSWEAFLKELDEDELGIEFHYKRTEGTSMSAEHGPILAHVFNHATHHRGQITSA